MAQTRRGKKHSDPDMQRALRNKEMQGDDINGNYVKKYKGEEVHPIPLAQKVKPAPSAVKRKTKRSRRSKKRARDKKSSAVVNSNNVPDNNIPLVPIYDSTLAATGDVGPLADIGIFPLYTPDQDLIPGWDNLITVRMYSPFNFQEHIDNPTVPLKDLVYYEIVLTGRNKVADIKDHFVCNVPGNTKETSTNGYLIIADGAYVDYRDSAIKHADYVRGLYAMCNMHYYQYDMYTTRLDHLRIMPYSKDAYTHVSGTMQDGMERKMCKHLVSISELRKIHASDPLKLSAYPRITAKTQQLNTLFCTICMAKAAQWIVTEGMYYEYKPDNVPYCDLCFNMTMCNRSGIQTRKYKVMPYKGANN